MTQLKKLLFLLFSERFINGSLQGFPWGGKPIRIILIRIQVVSSFLREARVTSHFLISNDA